MGVSERAVQGRVVAGHGVASGRAGDPRFPAGTIALQAPIFARRGADLAVLIGAEPMLGTINVDLAPLVPRVVLPEIVVADVRWSTLVPPENFWLFRAMLCHGEQRHRALIYMPDPATKIAHLQPTAVVEVIAPPVAGLAAGSQVTLSADPAFIRWQPAG